MTDPKRLLDDAVAPHVAELLRAADADVPPRAEARRAALLAALATTPANAAPTLRAGRRMRRLAGLGVAGALVVASAGAFVARRPPPPPVPSVLTIAPPAPPPARESEKESATPSVSIGDLPSVPATATAVTPATPVKPAPVDELGIIDAARADLVAGRATEARERVAMYRRVAPSGAYALEADVIEIQALAALGRTSEAKSLGARFLERHPGSVYEKRVRRIVEGVE